MSTALEFAFPRVWQVGLPLVLLPLLALAFLVAGISAAPDFRGHGG